MNFTVQHAIGSYEVHCERGGLCRIGDRFDLARKALIVTDEGVPREYVQAVASACKLPFIATVKQGEDSKSLGTLSALCEQMLKYGFSRGDCVVAVGGGVVGDLANFAASIYMRGIDFYNVPTTVLAAVDSAVGGKSGINFCGVKNVLGSFNQPKGVFFDAEVLKTLPKREISAGLAEAIKMSLTFDASLFEIFEKQELSEELYEALICRAVLLKADVVQKDEREDGLRKTLNFGHTLGHGIEAAAKGKLLHGECVALGMLPFCSDEVYERLLAVLKKYGLPTALPCPLDEAIPFLLHDKKAGDGGIDCIFAPNVGQFEIKRVQTDALIALLKESEKRYNR